MKILRYFSPWVFVAGILIALLLFGLAYLGLWLTRAAAPSAQAAGTAIINRIPAPTFTPVPPTPAPTPTTGPTTTLPPAPAPGDIAVGDYVEITGTGGDGLRVRSEAGLGGQVIFLAIDSEVFQVTEGPVDKDGYTWWYLTGPYDPTKKGWAVSNYLHIIQNP